MSVRALAFKPLSQTRCFATNVMHSPSSVQLSSDKMRALIDMYHQSETFVTEENLDDKIDEAFTRPRNEALPNERTSLSFKDFRDRLQARQAAPSVKAWDAGTTEWNGGSSGRGLAFNDMTWSGSEVPLRDSRVIEALYGVEILGQQKALPGWDAINENEKILEKDTDETRYEDSDN
ncbi:hypothetical protein C8R46DRAFT_1348714 [Mycena filopes]|nr:hypothetical protein C8R46DRAFT_1348714 [Mycena filopes]